MPRKKGGRSGTPDGYAPSPLGLVGVDSPRAADSASELGADLVAPPVPGWSGLATRVPCDAPCAATLEPAPVATGIGSHVHALLSPKLMTNAGLGAGDWVALAVVESPAAVRAAGGAGTSTPARGGGVVVGGGTPSSTNGANTPRTPLSRSSSVAGDDPRTPRGAVADLPPPLDAPAALIPALLARNVTLDVPPPDAFAHPADATDATLAAAAAAAAPDALGRFTVLARVHPNPKTSAPAGATLARKIWMSLGCPPGGAGIHVYPLEGPSAAPGTRSERDVVRFPGDAGDDIVPGDGTARAPAPGATCASATLRLWAVEGDASRGDWLRRGLAPGAGPRQRSVLEALARRALDGRCLLPGNLARLPLLGTSAYFLVEDVVDSSGRGPGTVDREKTSVTLRPRDDAAAAGSDDSKDAGSSSDDDGSDDVGAAAARRARRAAARLGSGGFSALGGVGEHAAALRELVQLPLRRPELFESCGVRPPRGVLLWGPPGTGKTRLARAAASAAGATLMVVRGPELIGAHVGESEAALRGVFAAASAAAPCVVLLDELDAIAPARSGGDGLGGRGGGDGGGGADEAMSARVVAALLSVLDGAGADAVSLHRVVVVATTNRPEAIDRALRRPGRFDREIEVGVPTPAGRREILDAHLRGVRHELTDAQAAELAADAHGFVGADVAALCRGAAMEALRRRVREKTTKGAAESVERERMNEGGDAEAASASAASASAASLADRLDGLSVSSSSDKRMADDDAPPTVTWDDFLAARVRVRPSALREVAVEVPKVAWDDVGGLGDVKQRLKEAVEWSERHPDAMRRVGAKPPKGILLYGPPGCSKTMLARAVASASGRNFLTVKGPELYSKWVGDSEKAVRSLFARARASAPSVVFLDELDGLVGARSSGSSSGGEGPSVHDRLLTQLLSEMDGLQTGRGDASDAVAVVAATNRPDLVDAALLRPGRFDRLLFIPPPRTAEDRAEILRVKLRRTPVGADVNLDMLAMATQGYTGADLAAVCREAALAALEEDVDATEVCARHFAAATGRTPPSPPPAKELAEVYAKFARPGAGLAAV